MKLSDKKFRCEWCQETTKKSPYNATFKNTSAYGQVTCGSCKRYISQKTKFEMEK